MHFRERLNSLAHLRVFEAIPRREDRVDLFQGRIMTDGIMDIGMDGGERCSRIMNELSSLERNESKTDRNARDA